MDYIGPRRLAGEIRTIKSGKRTEVEKREKRKEATYTVTYGEFLRYCRNLAGVETKSEYARKLGMIDNDHYIGSENDKEGKKPSLDLLERAARSTGHEFTDAIQPFRERKVPQAIERLQTQLRELLELNDPEVTKFLELAITRFHKFYMRGGRRRL